MNSQVLFGMVDWSFFGGLEMKTNIVSYMHTILEPRVATNFGSYSVPMNKLRHNEKARGIPIQ